MNEDKSYPIYKWYLFHLNYSEILIKGKLLNKVNPNKQQADSETCSEHCRCPEKTSTIEELQKDDTSKKSNTNSESTDQNDPSQ